MDWSNFWHSAILLGILAVFIVLYSVFNSVVYDNVNADIKNSLKNNFTTYFAVCVVMIALLSIVSFFYIRMNPNHYMVYSMIVTHISLLLSLTALSFTTLSSQ